MHWEFLMVHFIGVYVGTYIAAGRVKCLHQAGSCPQSEIYCTEWPFNGVSRKCMTDINASCGLRAAATCHNAYLVISTSVQVVVYAHKPFKISSVIRTSLVNCMIFRFRQDSVQWYYKSSTYIGIKKLLPQPCRWVVGYLLWVFFSHTCGANVLYVAMDLPCDKWTFLLEEFFLK